MRPSRVETWDDKQIAFDYTVAQEMTSGEEAEDAYTFHCFTPLQRWLLLSLISFYPQFDNRWSDDWPSDIKYQLISETTRRLVTVLACETDVTRIADILEAQLPQLTTMNAKLDLIIAALSDIDATVDVGLADLVISLSGIQGQITAGIFDDDIIDQVELLLNGIAIILGAPSIPILP